MLLQISLGAQSDLGTQSCYEAPGDLWVEIVENAVINIRWVRLSPWKCLKSWLWGRQIEVKRKHVLAITAEDNVSYWYLVSWTFYPHICILEKTTVFHEKSWNFLLNIVWPPWLSKLNKLINFFSLWNHQKTYSFLIISEEIGVN